MRKGGWLVILLGALSFNLAFQAGLMATRPARAADGGAAPISQIVASAYATDAQSGTAFRAGLTTADVLSGSTVAATPPFRTGAPGALNGIRQTLTVTAGFSNSGQSATFEAWGFYSPDAGVTLKGIPVRFAVTLSADAAQDASGKWLSKTSFIDTSGKNYFFFPMSSAPGAGSVDLWVGSN